MKRTRLTLLALALLIVASGCTAERGAPRDDPPMTAPPTSSPPDGEPGDAGTETGAESPDAEAVPGEAPAPPPPPPPPPMVPRPAPVTPGPPAGLPAFPWPPPRYSAFSAIERGWVAPEEQPTLASVARRLEAAFDATGYGERSYYWIPGGFALVSRIEQIRPDASPVAEPARWAVDTPRVRDGFLDHLRALFNAAPGFYRVIVFAVTDQDFAAGTRPPTSDEARTWASGGSLRLPGTVGATGYGNRHYTTALIYEFERPADQTAPRVKTPSDAPGRVHLEKAGLWQALSRR